MDSRWEIAGPNALCPTGFFLPQDSPTRPWDRGRSGEAGQIDQGSVTRLEELSQLVMELPGPMIITTVQVLRLLLS